MQHVLEEPKGLRRIAGFLKYVGKIIMFSSVMVFIPGILSLHYDLSSFNTTLLIATYILMLTSCIVLFILKSTKIHGIYVAFSSILAILVLAIMDEHYYY